MRVFFAVVLPPATREQLALVATRLAEQAPDAPVSWVPAANLHVTLRFLGDVSDEQLVALKAAAREIAGGVARFRLVLEGVGTFGGRTPRVIWVGARPDQGHEALKALAGLLESRTRALGFAPDDDAYSAHATLGRVREERDARRSKKSGGLAPLVKAALAATFEPLEVSVDRFVLYESRLHGPRHPDYVEAASFDLT